MAWRHPGDKPLSEPMMISLLMHICVTLPQWLKAEWHIYASWLSMPLVKMHNTSYNALAFFCWLWSAYKDTCIISIISEHRDEITDSHYAYKDVIMSATHEQLETWYCADAGWKTKILWHSTELGSLSYSLYKIPLVQACFPLAQPNFHSHWRAGER